VKTNIRRIDIAFAEKQENKKGKKTMTEEFLFRKEKREKKTNDERGTRNEKLKETANRNEK